MNANTDYHPDKFTELVLHVAEQPHDDHPVIAPPLGATLYFVEFTHVRRHGRVISGCEFQKLADGPAPHQLMPLIERLIASKEAEITIKDFLGLPRFELTPLRAAKLDLFTNEQLETVSNVIQQLKGFTPSQINELARQEPGYRLTQIGETIPYSAAFLGYPQVQTPTSMRLSKSVAKRYGITPAPLHTTNP